jgi:hypothetical protein
LAHPIAYLFLPPKLIGFVILVVALLKKLKVPHSKHCVGFVFFDDHKFCCAVCTFIFKIEIGSFGKKVSR